MTHAEFVAGLVQRDRNVIQKQERVQHLRTIRDEISTSRYDGVHRSYTHAQNCLQETLTQRAEFIASYIEQHVSSHSAPGSEPVSAAGTRSSGRDLTTLRSESIL